MRPRWTTPLLLATALALLAAPLAADTSPPDAEALAALMSALAQPVPNETGFVERRGSALLEQPRLLRGSLRQPDADTLVREVVSPHPETSVIEGERVRVSRDGGRERRFSLRRAPELAALRDSFQGLLAGDASRLQQHFALGLAGTPAQWRLDLDPISPRLRERVAGLVAYGREGELRCLVTEDADGGRSELLLGSAAVDAEPDFDAACSLAGASATGDTADPGTRVDGAGAGRAPDEADTDTPDHGDAGGNGSTGRPGTTSEPSGSSRPA